MVAPRSSIVRIGCVAPLLAFLGLVAGCGVDHSPVAHTEVTVTQASDGPSFLTFSPQAAQRAAKLASSADIELLDLALRQDLEALIVQLEGMVPVVPDPADDQSPEAQLAKKLGEAIDKATEALDRLEETEPDKTGAVGKLRDAEGKCWDLIMADEPLMSSEAVAPIINELKRMQRELRRRDWARIYDAELLPIEPIGLIGATIQAWHDSYDPRTPQADRLTKVLDKVEQALQELTEHTPPDLGDAISKLAGAVDEFGKAVDDGILEAADTVDLVEELIRAAQQLEQTDSELLKPDHDKNWKVEKKHESGDEDDIITEFRVPEHAVTEEVLISMTVYGHTLEDLVVAFEPGGLSFGLDATLDLELGNDLLPLAVLEELRAYHVHADGSEDEAAITFIERGDKRTEIHVSIPGFSSYGLRP